MRVVLDSNILWARDLFSYLLWLADDDVIDVFWCERILSAYVRHAPDDEHIRADRARYLQQVRAHFPNAMVDQEQVLALVPFCDNDADDRHVLATAFAAQAERIVTRNVSDFIKTQAVAFDETPIPAALVTLSVRAVRPDALLTDAVFASIDLFRGLVALSEGSSRSRRTVRQCLDVMRDKYELFEFHKRMLTFAQSDACDYDIDTFKGGIIPG